MSANIFGERFLGKREPAWHGLGQVFTDPITASEAVQRAGLDYQVEAVPAGFQVGGQWVESDQVAIVRRPVLDDNQTRLFGYASKGYTVIQNADLARVIDGLTDEWPVETVGALGFGEKTFFTLDAGGGQVAGEDIHQFFLVADSKKPGSSLKIAFTPVRVVCQNTLTTALRSASINATLPHVGTVKADLDFRVNLMAQMRKAQMHTLSAMESLTRKNLVQEQVDQILAAAYPEPTKPNKMVLQESLVNSEALLTDEQIQALNKVAERHGYYNERVGAYREAAKGLFDKFCDEHPDYAMTAWAVYNAIVECEDYRKGADSALESAVFGARAAAKSRAFQAALAMN